MLISNVFSEHTIKWIVQCRTTIILLYNEHLLVTGTEAERKQQTKQSSEWYKKCVKMANSDFKKLLISLQYKRNKISRGQQLLETTLLCIV